jgi:protein-tyrosine-phosphatase
MPDDRLPETVIVLCTANRCRSVMAAALLAQRLGAVRTPLVLRSAGVAGLGGEPSAAEVASVLARYGLDVSGHRSQAVAAADLDSAALILGMAREHVRHAAVTAPGSWPRSFTLKEIVRRAGETGPRAPGEPLAGWLARLHAGRDRYALLGDDPRDDVADPMGGPPAAYAATAAELDHLVGRLAALGWGVPVSA